MRGKLFEALFFVWLGVVPLAPVFSSMGENFAERRTKTEQIAAQIAQDTLNAYSNRYSSEIADYENRLQPEFNRLRQKNLGVGMNPDSAAIKAAEEIAQKLKVPTQEQFLLGKLVFKKNEMKAKADSLDQIYQKELARKGVNWKFGVFTTYFVLAGAFIARKKIARGMQRIRRRSDFTVRSQTNRLRKTQHKF